jgi:hypothetical protein
MKTNWLMLFREIISAFFLERENHKKHIDTLLRKCRFFVVVKAHGAYGNQRALWG